MLYTLFGTVSKGLSESKKQSNKSKKQIINTKKQTRESSFQYPNDAHLSYQMMHIFRGERCASFDLSKFKWEF